MMPIILEEWRRHRTAHLVTLVFALVIAIFVGAPLVVREDMPQALPPLEAVRNLFLLYLLVSIPVMNRWQHRVRREGLVPDMVLPLPLSARSMRLAGLLGGLVGLLPVLVLWGLLTPLALATMVLPNLWVAGFALGLVVLATVLALYSGYALAAIVVAGILLPNVAVGTGLHNAMLTLMASPAGTLLMMVLALAACGHVVLFWRDAAGGRETPG